MSNAQFLNAITFDVPPVLSGANVVTSTIPVTSVVGTAASLSGSNTFIGANIFDLTVSALSYTVNDANGNIFIGQTFNTSSIGVAGNIGIGNAVFGAMSTASGNMAYGHLAFNVLATGTNNIALGVQSGANVGGGDNNSYLGYNSGIAAFAGPFSNSTAIGTGAIVSASNQIVIGRSSEAVVLPSGTPVVSYVWTCQDTLGTGAWVAASGGGGSTATVSTTDATPTALATIAIPSNEAITINGQITARNTTGTISDVTGGRFTCSAINTGGVVSLAATPDVSVQATSTGSFNVVVSGTNLIVQVTGIAATNYSWKTNYTSIIL